MVKLLYFVTATKRKFLFSVALAFGLCLAGSANAQLVINVTGTVGSGTTTWEFSGIQNLVPFGTPVSSQGDGFFSLGGGALVGTLNNFQGFAPDFTSGFYGTFNETDVPLSGGVTVTGATSGSHNVEGFTFLGSATLPRFAWYADGAFPGSEQLTFAGTATAAFEISLLNQIVGLGDTQTVTASAVSIGDLEINFEAVEGPPPIPEPSTALLIGLGLAGLGLRGRSKQS